MLEALHEPDAIYVADPPFYCSAGITAAIDLSLALVEDDLGQPVALSVARDLVVYLRRPGGQSQVSAGLQAQMQASDRFRDLIMWMVEHPGSDLSVAALAEHMAMSERHFARQFRTETGKTPAHRWKFVEGRDGLPKVLRAYRDLKLGDLNAPAKLEAAPNFTPTTVGTRSRRTAAV